MMINKISKPFTNVAALVFFRDNSHEITSSEFVRIPNDTKTLNEEQMAAVNKLIERLEEDEDVQNVFHNMAEPEDEE